MRPMLATRGTHVPAGDEWQHEVKWDGMRVLVDVRRGAARLFSRNENDATVSFPELASLPVDDALLDGEVVAFADGMPSFSALAERMHVSRADRARVLAERLPVTLVVFDVLRLGDRDLLDEPLSRRRELLQALDLHDDRWQTPPTYEDGQMLFDATYDQALEGIVSKRLTSRYRPGQRSKDWLKFAHRRRESYVVGGWRPETDSQDRLGAVLVACSTGARSAAGSPGARPSCCVRPSPASPAHRLRSPTRYLVSTHGVRRGCSLSWSSTSSPSARRRRAASASRRTSAPVPT
jgi:bifunctional non-homologous end joining protein LigD